MVCPNNVQCEKYSLSLRRRDTKESKGLFSKLFLVTDSRLRDIHNCMFIDDDPNSCFFGRTHKQKKSMT